MRHPNADVLIGLAEGKRVLARFAPHEEEFDPLDTQPTSALHALFRPCEGYQLQGIWQFKLEEES